MNVNVNLMVENVIQISSRITMNVVASVNIWSPATCNCKNGKYLSSIIDNSVKTCDEIKEETKAVPKKFNVKNATCKTSIF